MFTKLWTIKLSDWERGLVCAIIGIPVSILFDWATIDNFEISFKSILRGAIAGGLSYIGKNVITGQNGKLLRNS